MTLILIAILTLTLLVLIIFPDVRKKVKVLLGGFLNMFVEDAAKTPEGAEAVFNQAIEEVQRNYNRAASTLNRLSGELKDAENAVVKLTKDLHDVETTCERLVKNGQYGDAEVYSARRSEILTEIEQKKECVEKLKPMVADASQIYSACGKKLTDLKRTKKETVAKLKMNGQIKDLLGDLDELRKDTATSKMLDAVMEGSKDLQKEVDGARVVHENRTTTKIARAEQKAAQVRSDEYLESLKKKYGGK